MTFPIGPRSPAALPLRAPAPAAGAPPDTAALQQVATQLQSVFAEQLFKAMRETVPQGEGAFDGGSGEEMFTGLMDQHLAAETPAQWAHGLTDSIVRQLRGAVDRAGGQPPAVDGGPSAAAAVHTIQSLEDATR